MQSAVKHTYYVILGVFGASAVLYLVGVTYKAAGFGGISGH